MYCMPKRVECARLANAASSGGHVLLCGPPGNGKRLLLKHASRQVRSSTNAAVIRLHCARLLAAAEHGALDGRLDEAFSLARRRSPCMILLEGLHLLASATPSQAEVGAGAG